MGDTIQFPTMQNVENELYKDVDALENVYKALDEAHKLLNELELHAAELEEVYESKLQKYIAKVGLSNIPPGLLQYSINMENWLYEQKDS